MDLTSDFATFRDSVQTSVVNVTRTATQVSNQDLSFHRSSSEKLSRALERQNAHLLRLTSNLLKAVAKDTNLKPPGLKDQDDIDDNWRRIVDVVDDLLEKADSALDEYSGVIKRQSPGQDPEPPVKRLKTGKGPQSWSSEVTEKPQQFFERQVDNAETKPWKPLLKQKPHATVPLEESIGNEDTGYKHPYLHEIEQYAYPPSVYQTSPPIPFAPPEQSEPIFIDTEEGVRDMLEELKGASEIAIDLEHNDQRSYVGMVCLMQISTRDKDWIIDTLKPWRENLQILNEVFADPKILKVFHGSNMDIIWLQRDLGLYVVGLFDTYHACCALQFPGKGLKHLLHQFANFEAQKQYQTADWRVRPLPRELVDYARSDTHFLLNIYDNLRNMLIERSTPNDNLTDFVLTQSKKEALQTYERSVYDMESGRGQLGWLGLLLQRTVRFDNEQFGVFRAVHEWRDRKARELDEGLQYVLPNRVLWQIAETMPTSNFNFNAVFRGHLPKPVLDHLPEIIDAVKRGKFEGRAGPSVQEVLKHNEEVYGIAPRRIREKKEPATTIRGLGATLKELIASGDVGASSASLNYDGAGEVEAPVAARSLASLLWGQITPQHAQLPAELGAVAGALQSVLPLLPAVMESQDEDVVLEQGSATNAAPAFPAPTPSASAASAAPAQAQPRSKAREIFTLKDTANAKKRKADESEATEDLPKMPAASTANGSISEAPALQNPEYESKREAKKQKKAEKKAKKEAEKLAQESAAKAAQPFDYAGAESLLTSQTQQGAPADADGKAGKKRMNPFAKALDTSTGAPADADGKAGKKRMNPFAKALDTSTGARRGKMGKELAGKSMTFTS
ncbi:Exosome complex exonuclease RRP6 [Exophiala dermatitidis]